LQAGGNWATLLHNTYDLSCLLVYENATQAYRFLNIVNNTLNLAKEINKTNPIHTLLQGSLLAYSYYPARLGNNC
jgi:hypothetical protein